MCSGRKTVATGFKSTDLVLILEEKLVQLLVAAKNTLIKNKTTLTDQDTVLPYSFCLVS